jgi:hypothetical protein
VPMALSSPGSMVRTRCGWVAVLLEVGVRTPAFFVGGAHDAAFFARASADAADRRSM